MRKFRSFATKGWGFEVLRFYRALSFRYALRGPYLFVLRVYLPLCLSGALRGLHLSLHDER